MSKQRTSVVWKFSKEEIQNLLDTCATLTDVCNKIGINIRNGSIKSLYKRFKEESFDYSKFRKNNAERLKQSSLKKTINLEEAFKENSTISRSAVKRFILKNNLINYICENCRNSGSWKEKKLSLQLEHKNGVNDDHRLENLCFLCPNCHSQTDSYAGKKTKFSENHILLQRRNQCDKIPRKLKFSIDRQILQDLINKKTPFTTIGKTYGVSDNAIRKRCKLLGIEIPRRKNRIIGH